MQYLAPFLPNVANYTAPLSGMMKNGQAFEWRPLHQSCVETIKSLAINSLVLRPIDPTKDEPIWVICDASVSGVGAMYGQGPTWQECRPAGFMSKKFTDAQHHYCVFEIETIAILESLLKWEDKLLGHRIHKVTDHKSLEFFKTQQKLSSHQAQWMEYLSQFDFDICYVKGISNKIADALSRYYESDTKFDAIPPHEFVSADIRLDPELQDVSPECELEVKSDTIQRDYEHNKSDAPHLTVLAEPVEERDCLAAEMAEHAEPDEVILIDEKENNPTIEESLHNSDPLPDKIEGQDQFNKAIVEAYKEDNLFKHIVDHPEEHPQFLIIEGIVYTRNLSGHIVMAIPKGIDLETGKSFRGRVIEATHQVVGHFGLQKTSEYI